MSVVGRVIQPGPASAPSYPPQFSQAPQYPAQQWGAPCAPWQCAWNNGPWYPQMQSQWGPAMPAPPQYVSMPQQFVDAESESEDDVEVVGAKGGFNTAQQDYRYVESIQTLSGAESVDEGLSSAQSVSTVRSRSSGSSRRGRAASLSRDECEGIPVYHTRSHSSPPCRDYLQ